MSSPAYSRMGSEADALCVRPDVTVHGSADSDVIDDQIADLYSRSEHRTRGHRISDWEAYVHLVRGNLGPGCLNLPFAFAQTGWLLGSALMFIIAGFIAANWSPFGEKLIKEVERARGGAREKGGPWLFLELAQALDVIARLLVRDERLVVL